MRHGFMLKLDILKFSFIRKLFEHKKNIIFIERISNKPLKIHYILEETAKKRAL